MSRRTLKSAVMPLIVAGVIMGPVGVVMSGEKKDYRNHLINEKSPYLLQHADNPVEWYPWGSEAFMKARQENKPIFLSIGYSTCHWCHVMEEESFSDPKTAEVLNEYFVAIKVDREERPDIDNLYMSAVTAMTGSGGWPLNVFLTPDKKPFFGGTYFPPLDVQGRSSFKTILLLIANSWKDQEDQIRSSSDHIMNALKEYSGSRENSHELLSEKALDDAFKHFKARYDSSYGGFGSAPKFPTAHNFSFLLGYFKRNDEPYALKMVEESLVAMAEGGIYDQLGGGFHRYSTDEKWFLPHFEKMLYDQALLVNVFLGAYQATGNPLYKEIVRQTLDFVLDEMTDATGGFYTAYDADSLEPENKSHKKEGAYYLWTKKEIFSLLNKETASIFCYYFGIEDKGNIENDPFKDFTNKNLLFKAHTLKETARKFNKTIAEVYKTISETRKYLLTVRKKRPKPHLDDKILVDWNGLMISAFANASGVFKEPRYREAAKQSAEFILSTLKDENGFLLHRYRDEVAGIDGFLSDYAFFVYGLIDLYQATFDAKYLHQAKELSERTIELFWDQEKGGFFLTSKFSEILLFRSKKLYDGALPSGNSIAAFNLLRLSKLTAKKDFEEKAKGIFSAFAGEIMRAPYGYTQSLVAFDFALGPSKEIVIAENASSSGSEEFIDYIWSRFLPKKVLIFRPYAPGDLEKIVKIIPFIEYQEPRDSLTTVYVCENYTCKFPVTTIEQLSQVLGEQ